MRKWWTIGLAAALALGACGDDDDDGGNGGNGGAGGTGGAGGQEQVTFAQVRSEVFLNCSSVGCHADALAASGSVVIRPEDQFADAVYNNLVETAVAEVPGRPEPEVETRVVPGDPAASYLYWKVLGHEPGNPDNAVSGQAMPPTCATPPCLPQDQVELIRAWIAGGATR